MRIYLYTSYAIFIYTKGSLVGMALSSYIQRTTLVTLFYTKVSAVVLYIHINYNMKGKAKHKPNVKNTSRQIPVPQKKNS